MWEQLELDWTDPPTPRLDLTRRLTALTETFSRKGPTPALLQALGWTDLGWIGRPGDELHGTGPSGIRTAFVRGADPIAVAVGLAFGQLGSLWPSALPGYLEAVNRAWQAHRKAPKAPP